MTGRGITAVGIMLRKPNNKNNIRPIDCPLHFYLPAVWRSPEATSHAVFVACGQREERLPKMVYSGVESISTIVPGERLSLRSCKGLYLEVCSGVIQGIIRVFQVDPVSTNLVCKMNLLLLLSQTVCGVVSSRWLIPVRSVPSLAQQQLSRDRISDAGNNLL